MKLLRLLTLAVILSCLFAGGASAQSGRARPGETLGADKSGGGEQSRDGSGPRKSERDEDYSRVFTIKEVTQRARLTFYPEPVYTPEARRKRVTGSIVLRLILRSDGHVDNRIEVLKSLPYGLNDEAIKVAKQIEFEPAQKDGHKVSQYVEVTYNFNIY